MLLATSYKCIKEILRTVLPYSHAKIKPRGKTVSVRTQVMTLVGSHMAVTCYIFRPDSTHCTPQSVS